MTAQLQAKDMRNKEICYEHISDELKRVIRCQSEIPQTPLTEREQQFLVYVLLHHIGNSHATLLGMDHVKDKQRMALAETITPEQQTMLARMVIMHYCSQITPNSVTDETLDVKMLREFSGQHWAERTKSIEEKYMQIYDKRHATLQQRIEDIEKEMELLRLRELAQQAALPEGVVSAEGMVVDAQTGEVVGAVEEIAAAEMQETVRTAALPHTPLRALPAANDTSHDSPAPDSQEPAEEPTPQVQPDDYPQMPEPNIEEEELEADDEEPVWWHIARKSEFDSDETLICQAA